MKPDPLPQELFNGRAVYEELNDEAKEYIKPHIVDDVLDATVRLITKRLKLPPCNKPHCTLALGHDSRHCDSAGEYFD